MPLPQGFVYLSNTAPHITQKVIYAGSDNFMGRPAAGYYAPEIICTLQAAEALKAIADELHKSALSLIVFDGYRPQQAVNDFKAWSLDNDDQLNKEAFYPNIEKQDLFSSGYIAQLSQHSRGSAVDLSLIELASGKELDMGTKVDFLDPLSNTYNEHISQTAKNNRLMLRLIMEKHSFENYHMEWWHFCLKNEPFPRKPEDHLDFPILPK